MENIELYLMNILAITWPILIAVLVITLNSIRRKIFGFVNIPKSPKIGDKLRREIVIDVQGRRAIDINECIEEYILHNGIQFVDDYEEKYRIDKEHWENQFQEWEEQCNQLISKARTKKAKKYADIAYVNEKDRAKMCINPPTIEFKIVRYIKQYKQKDNVRYPYYITQIEGYKPMSLNKLRQIYDSLAAINFETTTKKYNQANQRKLMTQELRKRIKERDNYTCQICGKYMPDEVGLHIDHIIPISKGGKTVEQNLQVLCDKCNLRKSDNI